MRPLAGSHRLPKTGVTTGRPQAQGTRCQPPRHPTRHGRMLWLGFCTAMRPICPTYRDTREGHRFLGTGGRSRPLFIHSGATPRFTKRNAIFMPTPLNSGCGLPSLQQKQGPAREGEREREREREAAAGAVGGKGWQGAGGGGRRKSVLYIVKIRIYYVWGHVFRQPQRFLSIESPTASFHRPCQCFQAPRPMPPPTFPKTNKSHNHRPALG
jgi:hypothetical protein